MLCRAFTSLVPALLALAFLSGSPAASVGGPDTGAITWNAGASTAPATARGSLTQDVDDVAVSQSADEDDTPDDRIVRSATTIIWPESRLETRLLFANDRAGDRHRPCAAPARAPPIA